MTYFFSSAGSVADGEKLIYKLGIEHPENINVLLSVAEKNIEKD
jgi:hypothetical protein